MRKLTREIMAADVQVMWDRQSDRFKRFHADKKARLDACGPNPTADQVEEIMGPLWVRVPECTECGECTGSVVEITNDAQTEYEYERTYAYVCGPCLIKALHAMEGD